MISLSKLVQNQHMGPAHVVRYAANGVHQHQGLDGSLYTTGYYAGNAPSWWHGRLAAEHSLEGAVDLDMFRDLLDGALPTGARFAPAGAHRRMATDITISAPKSLSLEILANGRSDLMALHRDAVAYAFEYAEAHVISARYGRNGVRSEKTGMAIAAAFDHEESRPVSGRVQPNVHTHCIVANVTRGSGNRYRATDLDFGPEAVRMHTMDALYKSRLAWLLESKGIATRQTAHGFELAHISDDQVEAFSDRRVQIDETLATQGLTREASTGAQRTRANFASRQEKASSPRHELLTQWRNAAREHGLARADTAQIMPPIDFSRPGYAPARVAVDYALAHLGERNSVLDREEVFLEAVKAGIGKASPEAIQAAIDSHEGLYHVGSGQIVTEATLATERRVINTAARERGRQSPLYSSADAAARIRRRETAQGFEYSAGQRQALELALTTSDRIAGVVGAAGVGKSTAMRTIAEEASAAGYEVVGVAPSEVAARQLREATIDHVDTLAAYQWRDRPSDSPGRYLILDEAGMVSLRDMDGLLAGLRADDRVLIVGDPSQLQPVEAGTPFAQLMREEAIDYRQITEVRRQHNPRLLEMANEFAAGRTGDAIDIVLNEYTHVVTPRKNRDYKVTLAEKREAIVEEVSRRWFARDVERRADTIIQVGTNETRHALNHRIRDGLITEGAVDPEQSQAMTALQKTTLTRSQQSDARYYRTGQIVRMRDGRNLRDHTITRVDTRQNAIEIRNRQTGEARTERVDRIRGYVYNTARMDVAVGDRILFRENDRSLGVSNGDGAVVQGVDADGLHVALERADANGAPVEVDIGADQAVVLEYGYARTVHQSQGVTARESIVAGEAGRMATAEQGHVAATRVQDHLEVVTDDTDKLRRHWLRHVDKTTARHAVRAAKRPRLGEALDEARQQYNEEAHMAHSADELDRFKRADLTEHLVRDGWQPDRRESSRGYNVMRRGNEKVVVTESNGHQVWTDAHDPSRGGTIIDYESLDNGRNLGEIRQHLRAVLESDVQTATRESSTRARSPGRDTVAERYLHYQVYEPEGSYLERCGLDAETVETFGVRQDERGNALFRHRDLENNTVGYEARNDQFEGFASDGERLLAMEKIGAGEIGCVVITDSTIDAMSHYQAHRDRIGDADTATVYISTGGTLTSRQTDAIEQVIHRTGVDDVRLAHGADASGQPMADRLQQRLEATDARIRRDAPSVGDWNEQVRVEQQQAKETEAGQEVVPESEQRRRAEPEDQRQSHQERDQQEQERNHRGPESGMEL